MLRPFQPSFNLSVSLHHPNVRPERHEASRTDGVVQGDFIKHRPPAPAGAMQSKQGTALRGRIRFPSRFLQRVGGMDTAASIPPAVIEDRQMATTVEDFNRSGELYGGSHSLICLFSPLKNSETSATLTRKHAWHRSAITLRRKRSPSFPQSSQKYLTAIAQLHPQPTVVKLYCKS
jgi:hypothetical protein